MIKVTLIKKRDKSRISKHNQIDQEWVEINNLLRQEIEFLCKKDDINDLKSHLNNLDEILKKLVIKLKQKENFYENDLDILEDCEKKLKNFIEININKEEGILIKKMDELRRKIRNIRIFKMGDIIHNPEKRFEGIIKKYKSLSDNDKRKLREDSFEAYTELIEKAIKVKKNTEKIVENTNKVKISCDNDMKKINEYKKKFDSKMLGKKRKNDTEEEQMIREKEKDNKLIYEMIDYVYAANEKINRIYNDIMQKRDYVIKELESEISSKFSK